MLQEVDVLIAMYQEHLIQARHQESERSTMTNLILVLATVITGLVTYDQKITTSDIPAASILIALGVYGAIFSAKLYERFRLHYERSRAVRKKLEELCPKTNIAEIQREADDKTKSTYPFIFNFRLYKLWISMMIFIAGLGVVLVTIAALSKKPVTEMKREPIRIELYKFKGTDILIQIKSQED